MNTQTIPMPNNPAHIDNLKTISLLKAQGFTGPDASLSVSLFEYGMAWRQVSEDEILIVHRNPSLPTRFDRTSYHPDTDPQRQWNWADFPALMNFLGIELEEWLEYPIQQKVYDLVSYYGELEIFGDSYWEGFSISDE